jgi:Raf kinase inhibitor-like YbhB/YbcL family protein
MQNEKGGIINSMKKKLLMIAAGVLILGAFLVAVLSFVRLKFVYNVVPEPVSTFINNKKGPMLILTSKAFKDGEMMPSKYTCDGDNAFPPLEVANVPEATVSLALVLEDPDAVSGTFDHFLKWNIAPRTALIEEGKEPAGISGTTSSGKIGYVGPCPPSGSHRYIFSLYALDTALTLPEGSSKTALFAAIEGHILEESKLVGLYSRQ